MEEKTWLLYEKSLTLPNLANKHFDSLRDENNEPIYTYDEEYMRRFVRRNIQGSRCSALDPYYKSIILDEVFNIISKELDIIGNICEVLDECFEFTKNIEKY